MTRLLFIVLLPLFDLLMGFHEPCIRKIVNDQHQTIILYFPDCNDSSTCFVRTYENSVLISENWVEKNYPLAFEATYSRDKNNLIKSMTLWQQADFHFSLSYYSGSNKLHKITKQLNDSSSYDIEYYYNGNIKAHGLLIRNSCRFGTWAEFDSLGLTTWKGKYNPIQKERHEEYENGTVIFNWCNEKENLWIKTDSLDHIIERIKYVDGEPEKQR